jgi:hypothetical protein
MPKATSAACNPGARTAADLHPASANVHPPAAEMHCAPVAASTAMTSTTMTSTTMTSAARLERGHWQNQTGGDGADKKRGAQHDDPPLGLGGA